MRVRVLFCTWLVICLLAMCLCFCFVWARGFCLSFLCAMCCHFNCLDPTHLFTWLLVNLPHLSSLVTLLICSLYNLLVFAVPCQFIIVSPLTLPWWYPALPCPALPCPALPCPALPCPALPCPALPCPALPCPALPCPALPCPALPWQLSWFSPMR